MAVPTYTPQPVPSHVRHANSIRTFQSATGSTIYGTMLSIANTNSLSQAGFAFFTSGTSAYFTCAGCIVDGSLRVGLRCDESLMCSCHTIIVVVLGRYFIAIFHCNAPVVYDPAQNTPPLAPLDSFIPFCYGMRK